MNKVLLALLLPLCIIIVSSWLPYNTLSGRQLWNQQQQQLDGKVLELDDSNFEAAISTFDYILVDFCVTWCSPCKDLSPELDKASLMLYGLKEPIVIARVNADLRTRVGRKYDIVELPTLKIFKHGVPTDYYGQRNAGLLVSFVRKFVGPDVTILESDSAISDFAEAAGTNFPIFLGFGLNESTILNVAIKYKVRAWFAVAKGFSESTMLLYGFDKEPALVALHPSCNWRSVSYGSFEEDVILEEYINSSLFPRVWQINQDTLQLLKDDGRKIVVTIMDQDEEDYESKKLIELLKAAASANPDLVFGYVGIKQWPYFAESFEVDKKTRLLKMVVWDGNDRYLLMRNKSRYIYYRSLLNLARMVLGSKSIAKKDPGSQIAQFIKGYRGGSLIEKHIGPQIGFISTLIRRVSRAILH